MKHKGIKKIIITGSTFLYLLLTLHLIFSEPPTPHNVAGRVFHSDGTTGAENGIPVRINNTANGELVFTETSAPPIPPLLGRFSATINGSDGDPINVTAWNSSHYGFNDSEILATTTTSVSIIIDTIRPPETNVTILNPANNTLYNTSDVFNVTANVSIIGGTDGTNCNATITFTNDQFFYLDTGETVIKQLGDMPIGSSNITQWQVVANGTGSTDITVLAQCLNDETFDRLHQKTASNITVEDRFLPIIELDAPTNNTLFTVTTSINITFIYNVTDHSGIGNCSLIINQSINQSDDTIVTGVFQNFTQNFTAGNYSWSVNCTDNSPFQNVRSSETRNIIVLPNFAPVISSVFPATPINLNPGTTSFITCNATIGDANNMTDVTNVNATFFHSSSFHGDADDNNHHYTNTSCIPFQVSTFQNNYTCSFELEYYANNGTWQCNVTAIDQFQGIDFENASAFVNSLLAINLSTSILDYGNLDPGQSSSQDINLTLTNIGNIPLNLTVDGFAVTDGDNLAMDCVTDTIPLSDERYANTPGLAFSNMLSLSDTPTQIANFTLEQRTNDAAFDADQNTTYWKLRVPLGIGQSTCNGTVTFIAINS